MNGSPRELAKVWAKLAKKPFVCWQAAEATKEIVGGTRYGYHHENNPTAELGRDEGGHDFLLVESDGDEWIFDFWASAYYGHKPIFRFSQDAEEIARLYGDRSKWERENTDGT